MKSISSLILQLNDLDKKISNCARCGMCQSVCPLFTQTKLESDVARGKISILNGILQYIVESPESALSHLNRCLLCGSCSSNCPNNVNTLEIFFKAKNILSSFAGLSPFARITLKKVITNPSILNLFVYWVSKFQSNFIKPSNSCLETYSFIFKNPLLKNRHFISLSSHPFHETVPYLKFTNHKKSIRVAFFVGCLINYFFPQIAFSVLKTLSHHSVDIFIPSNQACCGIPAASLGDKNSFVRMVKHNLKIFSSEQFDFLITACATCTFTIKKIWPMLFDDRSNEYIERINNLSSKTIDINQFLVSNFNIEPNKNISKIQKSIITYHDPCHLKKSLNIYKEPREILKSVAGKNFIEMQNPDNCCGLGGSFGLRHYDLSLAIASDKAKNIIESGCSVVSTSCPACIFQLSDILTHKNHNVSIRHPIEIYSDSL